MRYSVALTTPREDAAINFLPRCEIRTRDGRPSLRYLAKYAPVIGLEVHVQLLTKSKIFCACSNRFGDAPNSTLPDLSGPSGDAPNLKQARRGDGHPRITGHQLHSARAFALARKNYFYPGPAQGLSISQYELPLATGGWRLTLKPRRRKKRDWADHTACTWKKDRRQEPARRIFGVGNQGIHRLQPLRHAICEIVPSRICARRMRPLRLT